MSTKYVMANFVLPKVSYFGGNIGSLIGILLVTLTELLLTSDGALVAVPQHYT